MKIFGNSSSKSREKRDYSAPAPRQEEAELERPSLEEALAWEEDFDQATAEEWAAAVFGKINGDTPGDGEEGNGRGSAAGTDNGSSGGLATAVKPEAGLDDTRVRRAPERRPTTLAEDAAVRKADTRPFNAVPQAEPARLSRPRRHAMTGEELDRQARAMEKYHADSSGAEVRTVRPAVRSGVAAAPPGAHARGAVRPREQVQTAAPRETRRRKKSFFGWGLLIYVAAVLGLTGFGLYRLWDFLDIYERSLPQKAIEILIENTDSAGWRRLLSSRGVEDSYLDTLNLDQTGYYKKLELYTDDAPVYGIRFGGKTMLILNMVPGEQLDDTHHVWEIGTVEVVPSGLTVYVPEGAVITVDGVAIPEDRLTERNAQPLSLGPFESDREEAPGLSKYALDDVYGIDNLTVTDRNGNVLELSYSRKNAYYYAPLTSSYVISAPSVAAVTVNGILLTEENARVVRRSLEDFEGLEAYVTDVPEYFTYTVEGLVDRPAVAASLADGTALTPTREMDRRWEFDLENDPGFMAEQDGYIREVLDAYMAYSGNRGSDVIGNYARYSNYLYPGSEAADRASRARESIVWVGNRNTWPESVTIEEVIRYGANCYTALLDFTVAGEDPSSYLIIFYRPWDTEPWKVIRIMNKSAFL